MAVRFAGTTDQLTYSGTLPGSTAGITVVCWVYLSVDRNDWSCFTRMNEGGTSIIYLTLDASGTDSGWFSAGGSITGITFTVGAWHRVAATMSGSSATLYTATATGAVSVGTNGSMTTGAPTELGIGGRGSGDSTEPFNGRIAGWKCWNGVLGRAEIEAEWRQLMPIRMAGLHSAYPRLRGAVEGRLDYSGNGRMLAAGATAASTEDDPPVPFRLTASRWILFAPSGTTFTQSLSGAVNPSATLVRQDQKPLTGSTAPSGTLTRQPQKSAAGSVTPTSTLALVRARLLAVAGAIAPTGGLVRQVGGHPAGSTTPTGNLTKQPTRVLSGGVAPAGVVASIRTRLISLAGSVIPTGLVRRQPGKALSGTVIPASNVVKRVTSSFAGSITPTGLALKTLARLLSGTTTPIGVVVNTTLADVATEGSAAQGSRTTVHSAPGARAVDQAAQGNRATYTVRGGTG